MRSAGVRREAVEPGYVLMQRRRPFPPARSELPLLGLCGGGPGGMAFGRKLLATAAWRQHERVPFAWYRDKVACNCRGLALAALGQCHAPACDGRWHAKTRHPDGMAGVELALASDGGFEDQVQLVLELQLFFFQVFDFRR